MISYFYAFYMDKLCWEIIISKLLYFYVENNFIRNIANFNVILGLKLFVLGFFLPIIFYNGLKIWITILYVMKILLYAHVNINNLVHIFMSFFPHFFWNLISFNLLYFRVENSFILRTPM